MGTTAITFNDEVLTAAALNYVNDPKNMREITYFGYDHALAMKENLAGGEVIIPRWKTKRHSTPSGLDNGYELPNLSVETIYTPGVQRPFWVVQPVLISAIDETKFGGSGKLLDVLKDRVDMVRDHMSANGQAALFRGPAASGSWGGVTQYTGLVPLNGTDSSTGFLEAATSGTNSIHTVTKATYPATTHPRFHNYWRDVGSAAGVNLLNALHGGVLTMRLRDQGGMKPSEYRFYTGITPGEFMKRVLRPLETYASEKELDDGKRMALVFAGAPMYPIADMPTNGASTATQRYSIIGMNWKRSVRLHLYNKWQGAMTFPFAKVPASAGVSVALFGIAGNAIGDEMGASILITNAETF